MDEGWHKPRPDHLPRRTYWPAGLAFGVTLILWGLVTMLAISAVGLVVSIFALRGWIREVRNV